MTVVVMHIKLMIGRDNTIIGVVQAIHYTFGQFRPRTGSHHQYKVINLNPLLLWK